MTFVAELNTFVKKQSTQEIHSLHQFLELAWPYMGEGGTFIDSWHLHHLSEILEAVLAGEIKNLIINVPPRSGKSSLSSVAFPAFAWITRPSLKFIYASHSDSIAEYHSRHCRALIQSKWYQKQFGHVVKIVHDQSTKDHFENTASGHRIATSVQTETITGYGADIFVLDDPNGLNDSPVELERAIAYVKNVVPSRLNVSGLNSIIAIQQRTKTKDVTGQLLEKEGWYSYILPAEFEAQRKSRIALPSGKTWEDQRTQEGELIYPELFTREFLEGKKKSMDETAYAGQYQQRPTAKSGNFFKRSEFLIYERNLLENAAGFVLLANHIDVKPLQERHEAACIVLSLYQYRNRNRMVMMGAWTGSVTLEENLQQIVRMAHDCRDNGTFEIDDGPLVWKEVKAHYFDQNNKPLDPEKIKLKRRRKDRILPEPIYTVEKKPWFDQPQYRSNVITTSSDIVAEDLWRQGRMVRPHFRIHPFAAKDMLGKRPISEEEINAFVKRFMGASEYLFLAPVHLYPYLKDFLDVVTSYPDEGSHALGQALMNAIIYCWVTGKIKVPWAVGDLLRSGNFKDADHWEKQTDMTKLQELTHQAFTYIKLAEKIKD